MFHTQHIVAVLDYVITVRLLVISVSSLNLPGLKVLQWNLAFQNQKKTMKRQANVWETACCWTSVWHSARGILHSRWVFVGELRRAQSRMLPGTQEPHQSLLWPIRVTFNKSLLWNKSCSKSFTYINLLNSHNNHMLDGLIISPKVCDPYTGFAQSLDIYWALTHVTHVKYQARSGSCPGRVLSPSIRNRQCKWKWCAYQKIAAKICWQLNT